MSIVTGQDVQRRIEELAPTYDVPTPLALAVASVESNFNPAAIGSSGEIGVFQVLPTTAQEVGVDTPLYGSLDAQLRAGLSYLKLALQQAGGNPLLAGVYYNAGLGAQPGSPGFQQSLYSYVPKIADAFQRFGGAVLGGLDLGALQRAAQPGGAGVVGPPSNPAGAGATTPSCAWYDWVCKAQQALPPNLGERFGVGTLALILIAIGLFGLAVSGAVKVSQVKGAITGGVSKIKEATA